ncbi:hypothetical protein LTR05_000599 [Lithohypha guttulata]|uniref:Uncharacterized protein n=1 Tax=Lithohypha guttulata TaxID=1690604 RepID=A0AAN7T661_9EURO|nr:hypothetical protein LTR05_000599 [Lithohypha guttulata]
MATELVIKKRGRPRKANKEVSTTEPDAVSINQTSINRSFSTIGSIEKTASARTTATQKKTKITERENNDLLELTNSSATRKSSKSRSKPKSDVSESSILQQATAFGTAKQRNISEGDLSVEAQNDPLLDASAITKSRDFTSSPTNVSGPAVKETSSPERPEDVPAQRSTKLSQITLKSDKPAQKPSSFLDSFLSGVADPGPVVSEADKISDRAAFNRPEIDINDIVSGAGVTDMSSFPPPKPSSIKVRKSAIPITPPKAFKAYSLSSFPDSAQSQGRAKQVPSRPSRTVDPLSYSVRDFSAFRSKQPLAGSAHNMHTASQSSTARAPPTQQSPSVPPQSNLNTTHQNGPPSYQSTASLQTSSKPIPPSTTPSGVQNQSAATSPPQPSVSSASPASRSPPRPLPTPSSMPSSSAPRVVPTGAEAKRPTEMSRDELLRNAEFKSLRRRWTGLIIGLPVLITTSYLLWNKLNVQDQIEGRRGELAGVDRVRGVVPKRILDDKD